LLYKRKQFIGEAEFRIWIIDDDLLDRIQNGETIDETKLPPDSINGQNVQISDMPDLVDALVMAPAATDAFVERVKDLGHKCSRTWLIRKIKQSSLDSPPDSYI